VYDMCGVGKPCRRLSPMYLAQEAISRPDALEEGFKKVFVSDIIGNYMISALKTVMPSECCGV